MMMYMFANVCSDDCVFFFFKQKTAYEMRISDWSSDVCSSDLVSRRAVLEESRAEQRSELIENLREGQVLKGVVKNITDYGAFIDLGGVDGLLHVTDIAWRRINHPSEALQIGQTVRSEEHTSELQSLMRISYAVFCLKQKKHHRT